LDRIIFLAETRNKDKVKGVSDISIIKGILTRLESLIDQSVTSGEISHRFFEVERKHKCSVKYLPKTKTFELEILQTDQKEDVFQYDNIDYLIIEIFDLIN
jgi:uncharacterized protein YkuJ